MHLLTAFQAFLKLRNNQFATQHFLLLQKIYNSTKNIHLLGAGMDVTRIEFSGENATVLVTDVTEGSIQGFTLAYTGPEIDDDFRMALWLRVSTIMISRNRMTGTGFGIRCTNDSDVEITENKIEDIENKII